MVRREEAANPSDSRGFHRRDDVDQHQCPRRTGMLAGSHERGHSPDRRSHQDGDAIEGAYHRQQVGYERVQAVVACGIPFAVAMAAQVDRDRRPAAVGQAFGGAAPRMSGLAATVDEKHRSPAVLHAATLAGQLHTRAGEVDGLDCSAARHALYTRSRSRRLMWLFGYVSLRPDRPPLPASNTSGRSSARSFSLYFSIRRLGVFGKSSRYSM